MKILELFSGYGTASFALKRLGIPYEIVGYSDIDKYANQCFRQNHIPQGKCVADAIEASPLLVNTTSTASYELSLQHREEELGDIKLINPNDLQDFDLLTGGFPCQAFSVAGKRGGESDPRGTLFNEIIRIAEVKKPKYMLLENVKGLTNKTFKDTFNKILSELDRIGYNVYWKVLNSKDYGIPQSRSRVWFVCFRKDIDTKTFKWPEPKSLTIFIKDILEPQVDDKYYLSEKLQQRFTEYLDKKVHSLYPRSSKNGHGGSGHLAKDDGTAYAIDTGNCQAVVLGSLDTEGWEKRHEQIRRIYGIEGIAPTLPTGQGGGVIPKILGYTNPNEPHQSGTVLDKEGICNTLYSQQWKAPPKIIDRKLRRLTPKECFRLMGFLNDEINLDGLSDTQRYKLAGNGQDVNMVSLIFKEMLK